MSNATKRCLVIGNCQVQPLKHGLTWVLDQIVVDSYGVHTTRPADISEIQANFIANKRDYAFVITIPLSDKFEEFSAARIVESFYPIPVVFITNIVFTGLHPDVSYIGHMGARIQGPLGDYHSLIATLAFASGLPANEAIGLYQRGAYDVLGYFDECENSFLELRRREQFVDIGFEQEMRGLISDGVCFFSHNHPSSRIFVPFIDKIAHYLENMRLARRSGWQMDVNTVPNFLASSTIYPVYPEIARHNNLSFDGSYFFKSTSVGDRPGRVYGLEEFVQLEYEAFSRVPKDKFMNLPVMKDESIHLPVIKDSLAKFGNAAQWPR
ncbi:WcbI family polysaccharide biosynthesis putative acetyltransferase [Methylobacterium sp. Leaf466]|uniref:WcbI family polysaccharide biosynthesis putative acetyltransferase n=1 Tax=Methylobacterium sp. Leaf466 TaxID=1736386 RepID=UPI00138F79C6|nr:WcbI family polysaccharide biosynthesis putative acetyltransferase [Methylobacterium sp. Leaf466]